MAEAAELLREGLTHVTSPRYFGLFNPSVTAAGIAGDALAALYNPQLAVWSHAPAAQEMEAWILGRLGRRIGFGGEKGWARMIERQARAGDRIREALGDAGWSVANDTPLPVVCFTHPRIRSGEATTGGVLEEIYERGRVWISSVRPAGDESLLRACVTSFRTDGSDVRCLVEEVEAALAAAAGDGRTG